MSRITRRILTGVLASVAVVTGMMTISIAIAVGTASKKEVRE